jgi:hypothetical protein
MLPQRESVVTTRLPQPGIQDTKGDCTMHDILIALAFVAMVVCPAVVATLHKGETEDDV